MDIKGLQKELLHADVSIKAVLQASGYLEYGELDIEYDNTDPEQALLARQYQRLLGCLDEAHSILKYLQLPIAHEGILHMQPNGRYECNGIELTCGSPLEVLVTDDFDGSQEWVASRIEASNGYYFVAKPKLSLEGQRARIREREW